MNRLHYAVESLVIGSNLVRTMYVDYGVGELGVSSVKLVYQVHRLCGEVLEEVHYAVSHGHLFG